MPGQPIPSELKEKGLIWLLPPYCWSHRQIARKLKISASVVSKWRCVNRPGFPGECFICELRLPDHRFRWKHNKLFLLLPEEYGPAFPAIVDCYTSPPT